MAEVFLPWIALSFLFGVNPGAAAEPNQKEFEDYFVTLDTESNFDAIPFAAKLRYVFCSVTCGSEHPHFEHPELSEDDIATMQEASLINPRIDRTLRLWDESCHWYQQAKLSDEELDIDYMTFLVVTSEDVEIEETLQPYLVGYEMLSASAKKFVDEEVESMRGKRVMEQNRINFKKIWKDNPEAAISFYEKMCKTLPELLKQLENWPEYKKVRSQELNNILDNIQQITSHSSSPLRGRTTFHATA